MKNVTLRQLKIFEAVARHLSFSRAAEELHLTQPAVSMQVQALEELAGLPLTEQAGKKVRLTAAGEEVARQARRIAEQLREAGEALAALKGVESGKLKIGVVSTAKYFAPALLAEFRRRHPGVDIELTVNNRGAIVRNLAENGIDLAIMGTPPSEFETVAKIFAEHPLVFIAAPDHPLAGKRRIDPKRLAEETLLIREPGSGTRGALERFLEGTQGDGRRDDGTWQQRDHQAGRHGRTRPVLHLGTHDRAGALGGSPGQAECHRDAGQSPVAAGLSHRQAADAGGHRLRRVHGQRGFAPDRGTGRRPGIPTSA
jgi:DNA-binding transcriptional LysR family regulator